MLALSAFGQNATFKHFTLDDGLTHSHITNFHKDRQGFIWITTETDICRFDGYTIQPIQQLLQQKTHAFTDYLGDILEDSRGNLWFISASKGAVLYEPSKTKTTQFSPKSHKKHQLTSPQVTCSLEDDQHNIWIGTLNGLNVYRYDQDSVIQLFSGDTGGGRLQSSAITCLAKAGPNKIWVGTRNGLYLLNTRTFELEYYNARDDGKIQHDFNAFIAIKKDRNGNFWAATRRDGIFVLKPQKELQGGKHFSMEKVALDPSFGSITPKSMEVTAQGDVWINNLQALYLLKPQADGSIQQKSVISFEKSINEINDIEKSAVGRMWVGTRAAGIYVFDADGNMLEHHERNIFKSGALQSNFVTELFIDRDNFLWVGTNRDGFYMHELTGKPFNNLLQEEGRKKLQQNSTVHAIHEDRSGRMWAGTQNGLYEIDPQTGKYIAHGYPKTNQHENKHNMIGEIADAPDGKLWIGLLNGQLSLYDPQSKRWKNYLYQGGNPKSNHSWSIRRLLQQGDKLWLGSCTAGLGYFDYGKQEFHYYMPNPNDIASSSPLLSERATVNDVHIRSMVEDPKGNLWVGTLSGGLNYFDTSQHQVTKLYQHNPSDTNSISSNEITAIIQGQDGTLWLGTANGLNHFDPRTEKFSVFGGKKGLKGTIVYGMLEDGHGRLWLSTDQGISCFDKKTNRFEHYHRESFLLGNEFVEGAYFENSEGYLFFGGVQGITYFHPDSIKKDLKPPKPVLSGLKVMHQQVFAGQPFHGRALLEKDIAYTDAIELFHDEDILEIAFTALQFSYPENNQFAYKLENFDQQWNYLDGTDKKTAFYTNLDPGHYTFRMKAANADGVWNKQEATLTIIIHPPFWETWWFRGFLVFMLIASILGFVKWRIHQLETQKKVLEAQVAARTQEVVEQKEQIALQHEKLERQYANFRLLSEVGNKITASIEVEDIVRKVYKHVNQLMNAPVFAIGLLENEGESIRFWGYHDQDSPLQETEVKISEVDRLSTWCVRNDQTIFLNDVPSEIGEVLEGGISEHYHSEHAPRSLIYLPFHAPDGRLLGLITVKSPQLEAYTLLDRSILQNLANYIGIALENASAYRQIVLKNRQIESMTEKMKHLNDLKIKFFTNISHEFRTPLTLILAPVQALLSKEALPHATILKTGKLIQKNANRLLHLVNQLMDFQKIDSGNVRISPTERDVVVFVRDLVLTFQPLAEEKKIGLAFHSNTPHRNFVFDTDILEKSLYNLIANAFKFTTVGEVSVHLQIYKDIGDKTGQIQLVVEDTGMGIAQEELPFVFDRFYHTGTIRKNRLQNTGIGLSLVKELVELHQGNIVVESERGKGSRFILTIPELPLSQKEVQKDSPLPLINAGNFVELIGENKSHLPIEKHEGFTSAKPLALVVEDNPELREYLSSLLSMNYQIVEAADGCIAQKIALERIPDLIISDIVMPNMSGIELCKAIKENEQTSHIPFIMLTAKGSDESQLVGLDVGADDYIAKPFQPEILIRKIRNRLQHQEKLIEKFRNHQVEKISELSDNQLDKAFLEKLESSIEASIMDPQLDAEWLCKTIGMSKSSIYRKLKALTGLSINLFIRNVRLRQAAKMLVTTNSSIADIAYSVGFSDPAYFSKCFSEEFGKSPRKFAQSMDVPAE